MEDDARRHELHMKIKELHLTLCQSCDSGQIIEYADGTWMVVCHAMYPDRRLPLKPVVDCSSYEQKGRISRHDAEKIGWVLEMKKGGRPGFVPPKKKED